jgi:hypothetical protein
VLAGPRPALVIVVNHMASKWRDCLDGKVSRACRCQMLMTHVNDSLQMELSGNRWNASGLKSDGTDVVVRGR